MRKLAVRAVSALAVTSGWTRLLRRRRRSRGDFRLYILEYHDVADGKHEVEGTVSVKRFRRHLEYLKRHFRLETLRAAVEPLLQSGALDQDRAVITFDDGYAGNYESAWPALRAEEAPATIFLTTGFLDGEELWVDFARRAIDAANATLFRLTAEHIRDLRNLLGSWPLNEPTNRTVRRLKYLVPKQRERALQALRDLSLSLAPPARPMTWDQARELSGGGVELGAHTVSHPILSTLEPAAQEKEIRGSRQRIFEATDYQPLTFAYPNGSAKDYDRHSIRIVGQSGFRAACTTRRGSNRPPCEMMALRRIGIGSDPIFVVEARLAGLFDEEIRSRLCRR